MHCWRTCLIAIGMAFLCGCGSGSSAPPVPVYPVKGLVTYKGNPVVGADVTFFNQEADRSAFGRTNDKGEYKLTTFSANDGAVAGRHVVTIVKATVPTAAPVLAPVESTDYVPPGENQSTDPPAPKSDLPEKYGKQETSGQIAVVNAEGENIVNFNLED